MLTAMIIAAMAATAPTDGTLYRELSTDRAAFDLADTNRDGRISAIEFDEYKRLRTAEEAAPRRRRAGLGGHDYNDDYALTPNELYPEADYRIRPRRSWYYTDTADDGYYYDENGYRRRRVHDGEYYVDDRDGEVYDGR